jgi:phosphoribosylglycinamide formyltransferase-1
VHPTDTEETLHERIKVAERRLLVDTINTLAAAVPGPDSRDN